MKIKKLFYSFIHINFVTGILYAFYNFIRTPRSIMEIRRMWAYESWIILSFYCLFVFLILIEKEKLVNAKQKIIYFKNTLLINLALLILPWGLFLLLAPTNLMEMLNLNSIYWRILGGMSLVGALVYYLPYQFFKKPFTYYILMFGAIDNLLAGLIVAVLFFSNRAPVTAFASVPLLLYFSYFFWEQSKDYKGIIKEIRQKRKEAREGKKKAKKQ